MNQSTNNYNIEKYIDFIKNQNDDKINNILWEIYHGYYFLYNKNSNNKNNNYNIIYHNNFEEIKNEIKEKNNIMEIIIKYLILINDNNTIEYILNIF